MELTEKYLNENKMKGVEDRHIKKLLLDAYGKLGQAKNFMAKNPASYAPDIADLEDLLKLFKRDFKQFGIK